MPSKTCLHQRISKSGRPLRRKSGTNNANRASWHRKPIEVWGAFSRNGVLWQRRAAFIYGQEIIWRNSKWCQRKEPHFHRGTDQFPLLNEKSSDLLVPQAKNGSFDVSGFEMLNETTKQVAFTQASLWDSRYTMAVFTPSKGTGTAVTKEIISYLNSTDDSATVVNETTSQQVFTNHQQLKSETNSSSAEQPSQDNSQKWLYIGVLALIMVIAAVFIWVAVRRRKR